MKDKQRTIIEQAMKLFATKGVTSTSIQEIASESGISKGAFYLYFESKEALLLAIFKHYYTEIQSHIESLESKDRDPRETFILQLQSQYEEITKHKEFIIMHIRENALPYNEDMADMMELIRRENCEFFDKHLKKLYGDRVQHYHADLLVMLQGIIQAFLQMMILGQLALNARTVAQYTLNRLDDLVAGLEQSQEEPLLQDDQLAAFMCIPTMGEKDGSDENSLSTLIKALQELLAALTGNIDQEHERVTLEILAEELKAEQPRIPLIEGMLHNLSDKPQYADILKRIRKQFRMQ
ncbi:TetR/AcrR family transcriptional regulator [Paenibacillus sp. 1001270B_150601_E10]|uniref:TetR/AcrR family transcriptional regulator n=1 Tax=Paenibacillus sp. 1001270B_150601_E10 TaxID=2787079 RepID=UPI00189D49D9|nr:TetR/AcrR family transcriptional regulator [Paenibacillus sp. 1001270B_150601_E10]